MTISIWNEVLLIKFHAITSSITYSWTFEKYVRVNSQHSRSDKYINVRFVLASKRRAASQRTGIVWEPPDSERSVISSLAKPNDFRFIGVEL